MAYFVGKLKSLDIYRDGGSVSATFEGADSRQCVLFFPVKRDEHGSVCGFDTPRIEEYVPDPYTSPVTGHSYDGWRKELRSSSWPEASIILSQLAQYIPGFKSAHLSVFATMHEAVANLGVRAADS